MIPDRFRGGGDSGRYSFSAEDLVEHFDLVDGADLDVRKLMSLLFGGWILAWTTNLLLLLEALVDAVQSVVLGIGQGFAELISTWAGLPRYMIFVSWRTAAEFVAGFGPFAFPIAAMITVLTLWILAEGINYG
jgi:hypothetical protein